MTWKLAKQINSTLALLLFTYGAASADQLIIRQDPGVINQPINFVSNGSLQLSPSDSVAEFIVEFSPKALSNPLGEFAAYSSFRTVDWGLDQEVSQLTITEFVSDGAGQVVPIGDFEPVSVNGTGYTAGDVPFPVEFPFELRQFGVRIEGLQNGPLVSFQKDAQTNNRGGGKVIHNARDYAAVRFDDLTDDIDVFEYELAGAGELEYTESGLNFISSSAAGVDFFVEDDQVWVSESVSLRAELTINEIAGIGLAGVGFENPARWAAVIGASNEFGVGQNFQPDTVEVPNVAEGPFVVQIDFSEDGLTGHFWRPDSPSDVTTIDYQQNVQLTDGPLRLANNGADITYHRLWYSESHIPLPTGFEAHGDFNGNEILDAADLDFLSSNILVGDTQTDLNDDGIVDGSDLNIWVQDYYGTSAGDANLDRRFDSGDLVTVFAAGEYEDQLARNSTWATGDWNGDGEFDSGDLVEAFKTGSFEQSPLAAQAVPEPKSALAIYLAGIFLLRNRGCRDTKCLAPFVR